MNQLFQITRYRSSDYYALVAELGERRKARLFEPQLPLRRLSKNVLDSVTSASKTPEPNCQACGACCDIDPIIPVGRDVPAGLKGSWDIVLDSEPEVLIDRVLCWDIESGHCSHLDGELGKHVVCTAYEDRPDVCRVFEPGSDRCHEFRRMYGFEPQLDAEIVQRETSLVEERRLNIITGSRIFADSVSIGIAVSTNDPEKLETTKTIRMKIEVVIDFDLENEIELHEYDPSEEMWFETELVGMTLDEAHELIESGVNRNSKT